MTRVELARLELPVRTVFIVENQATYLAFREVHNVIVVWGGGYAVTALDGPPWLARRDVVYWGDLGTHGFAILSRLRERVSSVRSNLMDRATLLAHQDQLVVEPSPNEVVLGFLAPRRMRSPGSDRGPLRPGDTARTGADWELPAAPALDLRPGPRNRLRAAGHFRSPHLTLVLADLSELTLGRLDRCFDDPIANPGRTQPG